MRGNELSERMIFLLVFLRCKLSAWDLRDFIRERKEIYLWITVLQCRVSFWYIVYVYYIFFSYYFSFIILTIRY